MSQELVTLEIDGQTLQARPGSMLIEAADAAGISIPRFCYHKKLSVAANCRMCLVEIEKAPKAMPACATPVSANMKVHTRSEKTRAAQRDIMEFLLINHPLDCPICDQGGECELQDVAMGYGNNQSNFQEIKRVVPDKDIGPLIETAMTRCIQCTRCVRFGEEVAGLRELGATGRSERMEIGTYVSKAVVSELSGNVIDICPVGALTAKPSRYTARAWELRAHPSIAPHDAVGSNIELHSFDGRIIRAVPRENEAVNECWISDRDRFSYEGLYAHDRLTQPQVRQEDGSWRVVSWQEALDAVATILHHIDASRSAAFISPTASVEEGYLLQKLMRGLGVNNIEHRLRQVDFNHADISSASLNLADLEQQNLIVLLGANSRFEAPLLNHRIRKASLKGAKVVAINPQVLDYNFDVQQVVVDSANLLNTVASLALAVAENAGGLPPALSNLSVQATDEARALAEQLRSAEKKTILVGGLAAQHPAFGALKALANYIGEQTGAVVSVLPSANSVGLSLAGVVPGPNAETDLNRLLASDLNTLVLVNVEPEDFAYPEQALKAIQAAEQVIVIAPFADDRAREYASVLLPAATFAETAGTFVNIEGRWQSFKGAMQPKQEVRPAWKILRVIGNSMNLSAFDYMSAEEIVAEVKLETQGGKATKRSDLPDQLVTSTLSQLPQPVHMYRTDSLVRRAKALQGMVALTPNAVSGV